MDINLLHNTDLLYNKILSLKAQGRKFVLVFTKDTIEELIKSEKMPTVDMKSIDYSDMWFAGAHVYLGKMDKIILIDSEIWL